MRCLRQGRNLRYKGQPLAQTFKQDLETECSEGKGYRKRNSEIFTRMHTLPSQRKGRTRLTYETAAACQRLFFSVGGAMKFLGEILPKKFAIRPFL